MQKWRKPNEHLKMGIEIWTQISYDVLWRKLPRRYFSPENSIQPVYPVLPVCPPLGYWGHRKGLRTPHSPGCWWLPPPVVGPAQIQPHTPRSNLEEERGDETVQVGQILPLIRGGATGYERYKRGMGWILMIPKKMVVLREYFYEAVGEQLRFFFEARCIKLLGSS